jgi:hypothetical protein
MFGFKIKALTIGLAALAFGGTLTVPSGPANAQGYYVRPGRAPVVVGRPAFRPVYAPGVRRAYRPGFRRAYYPGYRRAVRPAYYGYRPVRHGYRRAGFYGPRYGHGYRPVGYYGRRYRHGYYGPRYRYGYYGYPYYRRSNNGGAAVAGLIGGLALGAIAANAARPVYYQRPAYSNCWFERRRTVNRYGTVKIRRIRVCG